MSKYYSGYKNTIALLLIGGGVTGLCDSGYSATPQTNISHGTMNATDQAKALSHLQKVDIGQGWIACEKTAQSCSLWNAVKAVNIDPYQDIKYQIGKLSVTFPKGRPTFSLNNKELVISLGGMFQYDVGAFVGGNPKGNGPSMNSIRSHLRRGRFIVSAKYKDFVVTVTPDLGTSGTQNDSLFEASLRYQGFRHTSIDIGLLQPRVTLEDAEGSNFFEFVERPMVIDLVRNIAAANARLSLGGTHWEKKYIVAAYVTGPRYGSFKNFQDNQVGGVFRLAGRPIITNDIDLHVGVSGSFAFHGENRKYSMNTGQEAQIWLTRPYLRTRTMDGVDSIWSVGPQVALRYKRFLLTSEYYSIHMQRSSVNGENAPNLNFPGWYVSANYTLFGQPRLYEAQRGVFVTPIGPTFNPAAGYWGALEWSARWSVMDLNSHKSWYGSDKKLLGVNGGKQTVWSTGFNWYPSSQVKIMLDYNHIQASSSLKNEYNPRGRSSNLVISRLQYNF
ncbi:Phosphate-selective porin (OprP) (PDB:2O4V) [Commensalibacter communis]|uniref:OprO/OprP family phosphate-selective porin n=1 Tax=Commensalibacter communis TaxID=2972786 RepID=UPI0022FF52C6|nr:porin [Commensalibacter communis]CAI3929768.1 Phosphate-selective porin (OprP) (PDB:2O4V) [Commensalibacter communis]